MSRCRMWIVSKEIDGVVVHERSPEECDETYTSPYRFGAIRFQNVLSYPP